MLYLLDPHNPTSAFPDVALAEREPDGLLAVGGDLSVPRLVNAYRHGIFPWFNEGDPILWWSPDPRTVLVPNRLHVSRSLRKTLRKGDGGVIAVSRTGQIAMEFNTEGMARAAANSAGLRVLKLD